MGIDHRCLLSWRLARMLLAVTRALHPSRCPLRHLPQTISLRVRQYKPSLDSGLLKSDCFGTDGRTSLLLISSHFFSLTGASLFVWRRFGSRPFCYIVVAGPGGQSAFLNLALIHIGRISRKRPILITDFHRANQNFEDLDGIPADGHGCRNLRPCKVVLLRNVLLELRDRVY